MIILFEQNYDDDTDLHSSTSYISALTTTSNKRHKNDAQSIIVEALIKTKECFEGKLREEQV